MTTIALLILAASVLLIWAGFKGESIGGAVRSVLGG